MGSGQVLCFFAFSFLLFFLVASSRNNVAIEPVSPVLHSKNVSLSLYYETLCPFCKNFIVNGLSQVFNTDLITILDLQLVPWGNALLEQPNNAIICQHGEDECYLNTIHACVINIWPDVNKHFNLIKCIEEQPSPPILVQTVSESSWKVCAQQLGLPSKPIKDCYDSGRGKKLLLQYGNKTNNLNPPHRYVPWVLVNEKPLFTDYGNFTAYVCEAYKGKPAPKACDSGSTSSISKEMFPVCPANAMV